MASKSSLTYIFHHVFLPPKLPHQEDGRTEHDAVLTQILRAELQNFHDYSLSHQTPQFKRVIEMINGIVVEEDDTTAPTSKVIKNLETMKAQDICAMHIEKQNAGIIIRRFPAEYSFETFELSPKNEDLMTTTGRLRRYFPGPAVAVPQNRVNERAFQEALLHCIESLVRETPIIVHPQTTKQGTTEPEIRDTVDPTLVTSMLAECLHAVGRRVVVPRIQKCTRDVVQWKDCLEPWRRSPHYLFLRVCLQIGLMEGEGNEKSHLQYKSFMIFFMCQILKRSLQVPKPREIVFIMSMKIQRRLLKLDSVIDSELRSQVRQVLLYSSSYLKKSIPVLSTPLHPRISILRPEQDTELSINFLRPYITNLSRRYQSTLRYKSLPPQCPIRMVQTSMEISIVDTPTADSLPASLSSNHKDIRLFLADIEIWVTDHLPSWLMRYQTSGLNCTALANLMSIYQETSDKVYKDIPEDQSIKLLTLLDLWIALDKFASSQEPLLKNYRCGFSSDLFAPLLLPTKPQMKRLASIEKYITDRNAASLANMPCIFSKINTSNSFSVRYFDQSIQHQRLRDKIIADAVAERNEKRAEVETKLRAFEAWKEADLSSVCKMREITRGKGANSRRELGHKAKKCPKCIAKASALRVTVAVHEWPLPTSESEIKSIVFELDVPKVISTWRDRTYSLLVDTFSPTSKKERNVAYYYFEKSSLKRYVQNSYGRIRLGSQTKPFIVSHYKEKNITLATTENILKPSGLNFLVIDYRELWQAEIKASFLSHLNVRKLCTMKFTPALASLQGFLESTEHTTNDVLAKQMNCPNTLTLHEYYQIGSLRSGCHLQWMNILREVESRVLDFNREEMFQLLAQSAWQAGSAVCLQQVRDSHQDLDDEDFGTHLLMAVDKIVSSVESNWQGGGALRIITMLTTRLLSVSSHGIVQGGCLRLLQRIQLIAIEWARDAINTLHNCQEENELESIEIRALELALTCNGTFDVDMHHLKIMLKSVETQAIFVESLITVHDRSPTSADSLSIVTQMCLRRFDRIAHRAERILRDTIVCEAKGINTAIQFLWSSYEAGSRWIPLETPKERWLKTKTAEANGQVSVSVEFNILTGELLINGFPLARLPRHYEAHETYKRLFGQKMLDVIPSTMDGMTFETRKAVCNQEVHFNMIDNELIVRTRRKDECFEVIPKSALTKDFTNPFIENYIFMRNDISGVVQLRPIKEPWISPENGWQITVSPKQRFYLSNGSMTAVDIRSPSAVAISDILQPLEDSKHFTMMHNRCDGRLEIRLPRFNLDFYQILGSSRLASKQFRGMFVDENQNIGTFTGLVNKLVLCNDDKSKRIIIIPDGEIFFTPHNGHVRVNISIESNSYYAYHDYKIDAQLGRLIDNGNVRTRLFKLYLHALTSDVLPDTLTGRTGTEEALEGLSSAAVLSFYTLSSSEIELLLKLRELSPKMVYYPKHKQSMQNASWTALPTLSQHEAFNKKVESIFTYAKSLIPFQDELVRQPEIPEPDVRSDFGLIDMAAIRNAVYRVDGFGAERFTANQDKEYNSRDGNREAKRRADIHNIAALVDSWPLNLNVSKDLQRIMKSLPSRILGPGTDTADILGYNEKWLDAPSKFLPDHWFAIYQKLSACTEKQDKYKVMIFLSTMVFSQKADQELVHTLLAFATNPAFRRIQIPKYQYFFLSQGFEPNEDSLADVFASKIRSYTDTPASELLRCESETEYKANIRRRQMYDECQKRAIRTGVTSLITQWPNEKLITSTDSNLCAYIDVLKATAVAQNLFSAWFRNYEFRKLIQQVQIVLDTVSPIEHASKPWNDYAKLKSSYSPKLTYVALKDLLKNQAPLFFDSTQLSHFKSLLIPTSKSSVNENDHRKVSELLFELSHSTSGNFEAEYCNHLRQSLGALSQMPCLQLAPSSTYTLETSLHHCRLQVQRMYHRILEQLLSSVSAFGARESTTMLPRLSKIIILSLIADSHSIELSLQWKRAIVCFGLAMTALQRAERMLACSNNQAEINTELCNPGHEGWDPIVHPDWLLLELENDILIRQEQASISKEMIEPSSGANSVMQLNMGLGKSSVIVPIVACALADKKKLCRVVVLRALSKQMMELLVRKLGGMVNRRIFFLPISRALQINVEEAKQLREIYKSCMDCGGVLLVQPEHLLSFELMGLDMALSGDKDAEAGKIINDTQAWLLQNSRDILDESDEILNVRFELIYTVGRQMPIDFAPDRWVLIQRVLEILGSKVQDLDQQYQCDLELEKSPGNGSFARFRVLRPTVSDILLKRTAKCICDQGLPGLSFFRFTKRDRDLLYRFITDPKINEKELSGLHNSVFATESIKKGLLLLRGLFAHGILHFAFSQKRWRVNFGLDLKRSSLAVPYDGKDVPAARSEFSHPETSIIMTCLAYYNEGLSESQAMECFRELLKSDNSQGEYERWMRNCPDVKERFKHLNGVNLSDFHQWCENVYLHLRRSKEMIDFYLNHLVFPKQMKEFPKKLSSSGWDIARTKNHPVTGFSGTNDSKYILPLSIQQRDLVEQLSTNAEVLACLLRPENKFDSTITGEEFSAEVLINLAITSKPAVRVILDVGAQVLELRNEEVASRWLSQLPAVEVQAAVFFDSSDELCVLNRDGAMEPLSVSPFAKQMDRCVIYLDEAHTRGTDLKLPADYRAIVTLGPDLNKDRLSQACMRMRKLGKGQSVVFCAPKDIQRKILECGQRTVSHEIEVKDVLLWCIKNTLDHVRKCVVPWAIQGKRHYERLTILGENPGIIPESIQEAESQSLEERYGLGKEEADEHWLGRRTSNTGKRYIKKLENIRQKCIDFNANSFAGASFHEEQERELQPERENEVQPEHAPRVHAIAHSLHPDVKELVMTGIMKLNNTAAGGFIPAFDLFRVTSAKKLFDNCKWPESLWITLDYAKTVEMAKSDEKDFFLRPVHWIVTFKQKYETCCVIFSPFEVQELRPFIEEYKKVTLSIYSPRLNLSLRSFENLDVHTVPPLSSSWTIPPSIMQLNLFAGQLYLRSYDEYIRLCQFLGLCHYLILDDVEIACDNFVPVSSRATFDPVMEKVCPFVESPVGFLQKVFALRRKGQSFEDTHMGRILNGELLMRKDFDGED
ncbi:78d31050-1f6d-4ac6-9bad-745dfd628371 [Sclerotinia trifoliorum]|uniref:ubiquitinyl hydrolase 1 n=1 Tax=Sclerotinia trifoliorum TaxID=28548 RepID=A0A8H2VUN8_9HELO|nr:78d31050-1f6d-4ac6-9bad-745dfd628371 [Sclerotinia trifoliorum]